MHTGTAPDFSLLLVVSAVTLSFLFLGFHRLDQTYVNLVFERVESERPLSKIEKKILKNLAEISFR